MFENKKSKNVKCCVVKILLYFVQILKMDYVSGFIFQNVATKKC